MNIGTTTLQKVKIDLIQNISSFGFWIFDGQKEFFVSFEAYPEFLNATVKQICSMTVDKFGDFHWEELDIDIEKASLENPKNYPCSYHV